MCLLSHAGLYTAAFRPIIRVSVKVMGQARDYSKRYDWPILGPSQSTLIILNGHFGLCSLDVYKSHWGVSGLSTVRFDEMLSMICYDDV